MDANLRGGSAHRRPVAGQTQGVLGGAVAIVTRATGAGTLAIRVLASGILLFLGLPILTVSLYFLGYPARRVPLPIVIFVDGLQLLIVAYAVAVGAQLVAHAAAAVTRLRRGAPRGVRAKWDEWTEREPLGAASRSPSDGWAVLRAEAFRLADLIWLQERRGRPEFGPVALAYVRDAVTLQLEYRRRAAALHQRALELETWAAQDSVVASERM